MQALNYLKIPIIIILVGFLVQVIGGLYKIRHWPGADELLLLSTMLLAIGAIYTIIKIASIKKKEKA